MGSSIAARPLNLHLLFCAPSVGFDNPHAMPERGRDPRLLHP
jgi:hypothetical protein